MIVLDADVLGRHRTGEETYLLNLLRRLPLAAPDLRSRPSPGIPSSCLTASSRSLSRPVPRSCACPGRCRGFFAACGRSSAISSMLCRSASAGRAS